MRETKDKRFVNAVIVIFTGRICYMVVLGYDLVIKLTESRKGNIMPTGYTADIKDGISFEQFIMGCARNFGALISLRDEPRDAPIPDVFEPSEHHSKKLVEAQARLDELKSLNFREIELKATEWNASEKERIDKLNRESDELKSSYQSMLEKAEHWQPPTGEHQGLKDFMIQQITSSIQFDCHKYSFQQLTPNEWYAKEIESAEWNVNYHTKEKAAEEVRCEQRSKWVQELKASI